MGVEPALTALGSAATSQAPLPQGALLGNRPLKKKNLLAPSGHGS